MLPTPPARAEREPKTVHAYIEIGGAEFGLELYLNVQLSREFRRFAMSYQSWKLHDAEQIWMSSRTSE